VEATIDALGRRTTTVYDPVGRAIAQISPLGDRTTFTYSLRGDRLAVTNARGYTQTAVFDGLGRAYVSIDALGRRTTLTFDPTGNVTKQVDGKGQVQTRVYDALGRNTSTDFADGTHDTWTFDPLGRLLTEKNQNGTWTRTYDAVGQLLTENGPGHPFGHPLTSVYDLAGNRTGLITWRGRETWSYDARNQTQSLVDIEGGVYTWSYEGRGLVSRQDYPNTAWMTATYDANGHTLQMRYAYLAGGVTPTELTLIGTAYDAVGNVVNQSRPNLATYLYDAANQLVSESHSTRGLTTWSYDSVGNRLTAFASGDQTATTCVISRNYDRRISRNSGRRVNIRAPALSL
jgi:YD repeat-containing protein